MAVGSRRHSNRSRRSDAEDIEDEEESSQTDRSEDEDDEDEDADAEWELEENEDDEESPAKNTCAYCGQDEDHDPGEEYEEPLDCELCGQYAHRYCARQARRENSDADEDSMDNSDEDLSNWRCKGCEDIAVPADNEPNENEDIDAEGEEYNEEDAIGEDEDDLPDEIEMLDEKTADDEDHDNDSASQKSEPSPKRERARRDSRTSRRRKNVVNSDNEMEEGIERLQITDEDEAVRLSETPAPKRRKVPRYRTVKTPSGRRKREIFETDEAYVTVQRRGPRLMARFYGLDFSKLNISARDLNKRRYTSSRRRSTADRSRQNRRLQTVELVTPAAYPSTPYLAHQLAAVNSEDMYNNPYGGVLAGESADTSKTYPVDEDREKFERSKEPVNKTNMKSEDKGHEDESATNADSVEAETSGASQIKCIHFGNYEIDTWYTAPYPEEYSRNRILYICEFCLKYMNSEFVSIRHKYKCPAKHPPGDEIYREGSISVFEVDGRKHPIYCQNLCLLAKLFLGSKTLYYDVEPFLFYIMTEADQYGCHFVGYFSKEKRSTTQNNVSCILTLPIHQRKGYGNLLIDFSYLLTRTEGKTGSPEKPLSDLGLLSYRNYWKIILSRELLSLTAPTSIQELSNRTGMSVDDVVSALENLQSLIKDPVTGAYAIRLNRQAYHKVINSWQSKAHLRLNPAALVWSPFVNAHSAQAPAISTVAPREEPETEEEEEEGAEKHDSGSLRSDQHRHGSETSSRNDRNSASRRRRSEEGDDVEDQDAETAETERDFRTREGYWRYVRASEGVPPSRFQVFPPVHHASNTPQRRDRSLAQSTVARRAIHTPGTVRSSRSQGLGEFSQLPMGRRPRSKLGDTPSPFPSLTDRRGGNSLVGSVQDPAESPMSGEIFGSEMVTIANPALEMHAIRGYRGGSGDESPVDSANHDSNSTGFHSVPLLRPNSEGVVVTAIDPALMSETFESRPEPLRIGATPSQRRISSLRETGANGTL